MGATQIAMLSYLVARLNRFQEQYSQVKLNIFNYNTHQTLNELKAGKIDLAIITTPFDHEQSFKVVKVKDFNSVLVGGVKYAEYGNKNVYLADVAGLPLITMSDNTTTFQFFQEFYRSCGLTMQPSIEVASMDLILPVILKNLGIGFVPEEFARPLIEKGEIVVFNLYEQIPKRNICIVSDNNRPLSAAAKTLQYMLEYQDKVI